MIPLIWGRPPLFSSLAPEGFKRKAGVERHGVVAVVQSRNVFEAPVLGALFIGAAGFVVDFLDRLEAVRSKTRTDDVDSRDARLSGFA